MRILRRLHRPVLAGLVAVLPLLAVHPASAADPVVGNSKLMLAGIHPAPDYAQSHTVFASGTDRSCSGSPCQRLVRSTDGGHSWSILAARGWTGGDVVPVLAKGRVILLAPTVDGSSILRSDDGGDTFSVALPYGGMVDAAVAGDRSEVVVVSRDGTWHIYDPDTGTSQAVVGAGTAMKDVSAAVDRSHAFGTAGETAAFAAGSDPSTGFPLLSRCDATLHCAAPVTMDASRELPVVYPSPRVDTDHLLLARAQPSGALLRSTDGGRSFRRIEVGATGAVRISQIQAVEFTPDFDAAAHRGTVYLAQTALMSMGPRMVGDVYSSRDGGATWSRYGGPSQLDNGVTAVAVAPDGRVFAAYFNSNDNVMGLLCAAPGKPWADSCPAYAAGSASGAYQAGGSAQNPAGAEGTAAANHGHASGLQGAGAGGVSAMQGTSSSSSPSSAARLTRLGVIAAAVACVLTAAALWRMRRSPVRPA